MGIDIYARWRGQSEAERNAQITGFSVEHGFVGYLREAYHGRPYVTMYLFAEAFDSDVCEAAIPARVMRGRLPAAVLMSMYREHTLYGANEPAVADLEHKGDLSKLIADIVEHKLPDRSHEEFVRDLDAKSLDTAQRLIDADALAPAQRSFVQFVLLCERKEHETGEPCTILASY
jgi:hypothetical protein